ncbi:MAG: beta galactosidase jelly roll domain-containing protein [Ignavibacteriales bacterium]|nr:beta galactosidase jelly roll domain-containing protein [Ignavibacteriales bacterium]
MAGEWEYSTDNGTSWSTVKIPAAADYEGRMIFRKKFLIDSEAITSSVFKFVSFGINYGSELYINETFVGKHEGGYTSFELPIPENVIQVGAENIIRIVVDNSLNYRTTFPTRAQVNGWKNYGGITRDIFIVATPRVWIDHLGVVVEAIEPKATRLLVTSTISSSDLQLLPQLGSKLLQLSAEVSETTSGTIIGKPYIIPVIPESNKDITEQIAVSIPNAKLWSPESPELYTIKVSLIASEAKKDSLIDETSITTGIRTFTKNKNVLLFNGAPIVLRGVVWVEDSEKYGSALTYEEMEKDVALIKNLGANVVRIGFNPAHPFFIQLCNKYGLFVLQEIPNVEIPEAIGGDDLFRALMEQRLKEMIERDKHNPSIIAWGLGEATGNGRNDGPDALLHLQRVAKSLDDRLTYSILRHHQIEENVPTDIAALTIARVDVKTFRSVLSEYKQSHPNQPMLVAGYGKPAEKGNRNGYSDPGSQEAQARYIHQRFAAIKDLSISGSIIFTFNDFRSDRPVLRVGTGAIDMHTNGIVELGREKKIAYDMVHSLYHDQKVSALPIGTYVPSSPYIYIVIGVGLLIVAAWLVNGNRRFRESTWRAIFRSYNFFADIRDQFTLPLYHTTLTALIISMTFSVVMASILHHFRSSEVLDYLLSYVLSDGFKSVVIQMAWNPLLSVGYLTAVMLGWFVILTILIQFFSKMARVKIRIFHSYSIAIWTASPWIFFIPVCMILYRVLESEPYVPWVLGLVLLMSLWVFLRTLKGVSVIYHVYTPKMYMIGIVFMVVLFGGLYAYWDYAFSLTSYAEFFVSTVLPSLN